MREGQARDAQGLPVTNSQRSLQDWLQDWLNDVKAHAVRPRTLDLYRSRLQHVVDAIGGKKLADIRPADIRRVYADGSKVGNRLKLTSVSKSLSIGMRLLATSLGYSACLYEVAVSETKVIGGRTVNQSPWWQLVLRKPSRGQHRDEQHDYGRVRRVQPTNEKEVVYDITVETDESFVADGFTVHNCQDISIAGKGAGLAGERSGLFFEATRVVSELRPSLVLFENVPRLLSIHSGRDFALVLRTLHELGARDIAWRVLDAVYLGVPQLRRRVFIAADFRSERTASILFESESGSWHPATRRKAGQGVAASLTRGSATGSGVNPPGRRQEDDVNIVAATREGGSGERGWKVDAEGAAGNQLILQISPALTTSQSRLNGNDEALVVHTLSAEGADASEDGTGRGTPLVVAEADYGVRRLMPIECERLQGLPDGWTAELSDSARYRLIGNSIAVPVIEWIGRRIFQHIQTATESVA